MGMGVRCKAEIYWYLLVLLTGSEMDLVACQDAAN